MSLDKTLDEKIADAEKRWETSKPSRDAALTTAIDLVNAEKRRESDRTYRMESAKLASKQRVEYLDGVALVLGEMKDGDAS